MTFEPIDPKIQLETDLEFPTMIKCRICKRKKFAVGIEKKDATHFSILYQDKKNHQTVLDFVDLGEVDLGNENILSTKTLSNP